MKTITLIAIAAILSGCNVNHPNPAQRDSYLDHPCDRLVISNEERIMYECEFKTVRAI